MGTTSLSSALDSVEEVNGRGFYKHAGARKFQSDAHSRDIFLQPDGGSEGRGWSTWTESSQRACILESVSRHRCWPQATSIGKEVRSQPFHPSTKRGTGSIA